MVERMGAVLVPLAYVLGGSACDRLRSDLVVCSLGRLRSLLGRVPCSVV